LGNASQTGDSFSKEAIDTLNLFLSENYRDTVVIIAGYKKELEECFFSSNPGLKRRFPWSFTLENFTPVEIIDVFKLKIDWDYNDHYEEILEKVTSNIGVFGGNGGDIDNIITRAKIINTRRNFLNGSNILETGDILAAINQFIKTKSVNLSSSPPFGMYT
jgi:hypothetical protein